MADEETALLEEEGVGEDLPIVEDPAQRTIPADYQRFPGVGNAPYRIASRNPETGELRVTTGFSPQYDPNDPRVRQPDLVQPPSIDEIYRSAFAQLPVEQATKAIESSLRYLGIRGYQKELERGGSAADALAKWGPMLFHGSPAGMASIARLGQPPALTPYQAQSLEERRRHNLATEGGSGSAKSTFGRLLADRAAAQASGRTDEVKLYDAQIAAFGQKEGLSIQQDDQGRMIINYGPQATGIGKPSVATQTMAQRKLLKYEAASELMNRLGHEMEAGHVGLRGVLGETFGDRIFPQFGLDTFSGKRVDVRTLLVAARENLLREISDDTRFSNIDREEISKALPSSGVFESFQDAKRRLETVRQILSQRGKVYAEGMGLTPPTWSLSREEIKALFQSGKLTREQALDALERFH